MKKKKGMKRGWKIKNEYIISAILSFGFKSLPLFSNPYTHKFFIGHVVSVEKMLLIEINSNKKKRENRE